MRALKFVTMASKLEMFLIFQKTVTFPKFCSSRGVEKGCNCENRMLVTVFKLNFHSQFINQFIIIFKDFKLPFLNYLANS